MQQTKRYLMYGSLPDQQLHAAAYPSFLKGMILQLFTQKYFSIPICNNATFKLVTKFSQNVLAPQMFIFNLQITTFGENEMLPFHH